LEVRIIEIDKVHGDVVERDNDGQDREEDGDYKAVVKELFHAHLPARYYAVLGRTPWSCTDGHFRIRHYYYKIRQKIIRFPSRNYYQLKLRRLIFN